jgi:DNA-binding NtrC family response regulator
MPERSVRVLLVEDHRGLLDTLADILRDTGMEVDTAFDASSAIGKLGGEPYDVAVVDLVLPGPSGVEVIRKLKSISPTTRIFACTAYYESELLAQAQALGIHQTVFKPADPAQLIKLIERAVAPATDEKSQAQF